MLGRSLRLDLIEVPDEAATAWSEYDDARVRRLVAEDARRRRGSRWQAATRGQTGSQLYLTLLESERIDDLLLVERSDPLKANTEPADWTRPPRVAASLLLEKIAQDAAATGIAPAMLFGIWDLPAADVGRFELWYQKKLLLDLANALTPIGVQRYAAIRWKFDEQFLCRLDEADRPCYVTILELGRLPELQVQQRIAEILEEETEAWSQALSHARHLFCQRVLVARHGET